jgi:hypothetical protein
MIEVMPKFSIKDLLIATTLMALGFGGATYAWNYNDVGNRHPGLLFTLDQCRCMASGAGVMFPLKRIRWIVFGMLIGFNIGFVVLLVSVSN